MKTPKPMVAAITPAGGLVFTGDLSYAADGKQYVAAAAGLNSAIWPVKEGPASVYVYAFP